MAYILKATARFEPEELIGLLRERPDLLHPRIRFLQGPFPIQNLGRLDLLGLDDQGGWVMVKIAEEGNGDLLLTALHQVAWVRDNSQWVKSLPSYEAADPLFTPAVFLVAPHFSNSLADVLAYMHGVTVGLVKYSGFQMGEQKAIHFEPLYAGQSPLAAPVAAPVPAMAVAPAAAAPAVAEPEPANIVNLSEPVEEEDPKEPNLSLLQPLTDEEIAEFLPGHTKDKMA